MITSPFLLTNWLSTLPDFKFLNASPDFVSKMIPSNRCILNYDIVENIHNSICDVLRIITVISSRYKMTVLNVEIETDENLEENPSDYPNIMINCVNERRLWDIPHLCILDTSRILTWIPVLNNLCIDTYDHFLILGDGLGYISLYLKLITDNPNVIPFNYINENDLSDEALSNDWNVYNSEVKRETFHSNNINGSALNDYFQPNPRVGNGLLAVGRFLFESSVNYDKNNLIWGSVVFNEKVFLDSSAIPGIFRVAMAELANVTPYVIGIGAFAQPAFSAKCTGLVIGHTHIGGSVTNKQRSALTIPAFRPFSGAIEIWPNYREQLQHYFQANIVSDERNKDLLLSWIGADS
ncbi:hypothetical protein GJ496_005982 [Pomphorhynchus laevis]|nr:hypothetical protein GJ496_005982 [Pomphorhynchus laevis]